jgi:hypothetical protein
VAGSKYTKSAFRRSLYLYAAHTENQFLLWKLVPNRLHRGGRIHQMRPGQLPLARYVFSQVSKFLPEHQNYPAAADQKSRI